MRKGGTTTENWLALITASGATAISEIWVAWSSSADTVSAVEQSALQLGAVLESAAEQQALRLPAALQASQDSVTEVKATKPTH